MIKFDITTWIGPAQRNIATHLYASEPETISWVASYRDPAPSMSCCSVQEQHRLRKQISINQRRVIMLFLQLKRGMANRTVRLPVFP